MKGGSVSSMGCCSLSSMAFTIFSKVREVMLRFFISSVVE